MKCFKSGSVLAVLILSSFSAQAATEFKEGELIVKFKRGLFRTRDTMDRMYDRFGVANVKFISPKSAQRYGATEHWILEDGQNMDSALKSLRANPLVEYAHPNYILSIPEKELNRFPEDGLTAEKPDVQAPPAEVIPGKADPRLNQAWGIGKIASEEAWKTGKGSKDLIVAVIDTGIDYNHEDLSFNVWRNPNPTENDVTGYDFIHNDGLPYDDHSHGTHCAGTIGGVGMNGVGVSGVAQRVSIMGLKFLSAQGSGTTADAVRAIDYAVQNGAKVLSNSWGGGADEDNQALQDAVNRAESAGVLFIAAAGNESNNNDNPAEASYPAAFTNSNMISVAATGRWDSMAYFSNYGVKTTHLGAPGVSIYSTTPGNNYASMSGTSMAAPHVSGAAALVWATFPTLNYRQVKAALLDTVDPLYSLNGKTSTGGRLNVGKAIKKAALLAQEQ